MSTKLARALSMMLAVLLCIGLVACGPSDGDTTTTTTTAEIYEQLSSVILTCGLSQGCSQSTS